MSGRSGFYREGLGGEMCAREWIVEWTVGKMTQETLASTRDMFGRIRSCCLIGMFGFSCVSRRWGA